MDAFTHRFKPLSEYHTQGQWLMFMRALGFIELGVEGPFILWDIRPVGM